MLWLVAAVAAGVLGAAPPALAKEGDVIAEGPCSGQRDWKLKLSPENGAIEVEFEVDQKVIGDRWQVSLADNGTVFFSGRRITKAPSGSFEVRRIITDAAGPDNVTGTATNLRTGETCQAAATF